MQTTGRKKLEVIIEATVLRRVEQLLHEAGVRGWTVLPSIEGHGSGGDWSSGDFTPGQERRMIVAVAGADVAAQALDRLAGFFADYPGIVFVSDVQVLRPERF